MGSLQETFQATGNLTSTLGLELNHQLLTEHLGVSGPGPSFIGLIGNNGLVFWFLFLFFFLNQQPGTMD